MSELSDALRIVLADTFTLYLKTHFFHWNVTGQDFYEYHLLFEKQYNDLWEAVDGIAEEIRSLDEFTPGSQKRFLELTTIAEHTNIPESFEMIAQLVVDHEKTIKSLRKAHKAAEQQEAYGIVNFLEDRLDHHFKMLWMLRSTIKNTKR
jgi:starvation-inducible DNA-binding protein